MLNSSSCWFTDMSSFSEPLLQKRLFVFPAEQQTAVGAWWHPPQYQQKSRAVKFDKQKDERLTVWGPDTQLLLHPHCLAVVAASSLAGLCKPEDEDSLPPAECTASRQKEEVKEKEGSSKSQGRRNQIPKSEWVGQTLPLANATAQLLNVREMQWCETFADDHGESPLLQRRIIWSCWKAQEKW